MRLSLRERLVMFKLIREILTAYLELLTEKVKEYRLLHETDQFNIMAGRAIEEISYRYPATYEDAAIIYEEWCKGLISECRLDGIRLREYAKYTSDSDRYREWVRKYNK